MREHKGAQGSIREQEGSPIRQHRGVAGGSLVWLPGTRLCESGTERSAVGSTGRRCYNMVKLNEIQC